MQGPANAYTGTKVS